jgi:magnesium chelatase family protein
MLVFIVQRFGFMKVTSFYREGLRLCPMEIELTLIPGLPQIKILGLPDTVAKESIDRIRVALKAQGFVWPKARQIMVQLHPVHVKKSSLGLDLAIAAAYLWETGQVELPDQNPVLYGRLTLSGEVQAPADISEILGVDSVFTGPVSGAASFDLKCLTVLKDIFSPVLVNKTEKNSSFVRPLIPDINLDPTTARLLSIASTGEHSLLLAGQAGSGKTTAARLLYCLLTDPSESTFRESEIVARSFNEKIGWRPLAQPHHTTPAISMVGGARPPKPGEITRAHGGLLLLDEFVEFDSHVREALREPIETGRISVSRVGERIEFPADFLLAATSNLCKCGKYYPENDSECTCDEKARVAYIKRLSGPVLDRFAILYFTKRWFKDQLTVEAKKIFEEVKRARAFAKESRRQEIVNSRLDPAIIFESMNSFVKNELLPQSFESARRYQSVLRVARTIADLSQSPQVLGVHIKEAMEFSWTPFGLLRKSVDVASVDRLRQFVRS